MFVRQSLGRTRVRRCGPSASVTAVVHRPDADQAHRQLRRVVPAVSAWRLTSAKSAAPDIQAWAWMNALALDHAGQKRQRPGDDPRRREHHRQRDGGFGALEKRQRRGGRLEAVRRREEAARRGRSDGARRRRRQRPISRAAGTTTRAGELTALITARVSDVLPNGDMVVEGVREVEINGDRQIVVLTGVVRGSGHRSEQRRARPPRSANCGFAISAAG